MSTAHASLSPAPTHCKPRRPRITDPIDPLLCSLGLLRLRHSSAAIPDRRHRDGEGAASA